MVSLVHHVHDLVDIIVAPEIPNTNPSKNFASIHLKNYLMQTLGSKDAKPKAGSQAIIISEIVECSRLLLQTLMQNLDSPQRQSHIQLSLEMLLLCA